MIGVGLISSSFTVNETDGYLTVGVEILDGSLELERSVLISTQAGTATPGTCVLWLENRVYICIGSLSWWFVSLAEIFPLLQVLFTMFHNIFPLMAIYIYSIASICGLV